MQSAHLAYARSLLSRAKLSTLSLGNHRNPSRVLAIVSVLGLAACGFQPLYATAGPGGTISKTLAQVQVEPVNGEQARQVAFALEDRMQNRNAVDTLYRIQISTLLAVNDVAVEQNTDVTRKNVVLSTQYTLIQNDTSEMLFRREARAINAYNRVESEFANLVAERDAIQRAADQIATSIEQDLAVFFTRQGE